MAGIYVHIPFCRKACHYCNFYFLTQRNGLRNLVPALLTEARLASEEWELSPVNSIYLGGGTPSLLAEESLIHLLNGLHRHFNVSSEAEITLEANPEDIPDLKTLQSWKRAGINRLSLGLQSLDDHVLASMNRSHNAEQCLKVLDLVSEAAFTNYSCDLMYGIPEQSWEKVEELLRCLTHAATPHISAYALTVEPKTALNHMIRQGKHPQVDEAQASDELERIIAFLSSQGFRHYEVSNFALQGMESRHNSSYWDLEPYLGLGPAAHGFLNGKRYSNPASFHAWRAALEQDQLCWIWEERSSVDTTNELIMTGLRRDVGIQKHLWDRYSLVPWEQLLERAKALETGSLRINKNSIVLKEQAIHWADGIAASLFFSPEELGTPY